MTKTLKIVFKCHVATLSDCKPVRVFVKDISRTAKCKTHSQQFQMLVGWPSSVWDQHYEDLEQVI